MRWSQSRIIRSVWVRVEKIVKLILRKDLSSEGIKNEGIN